MWRRMTFTRQRRESITLSRRRGGVILEYVAIAGVLALATFLDFWRLSANGYGNLYYAAAVLSMTQNWHNFFFVSYDPGGFISVDKPPLGFWVMVASVKLLGYSGFSLLAPEALAGVGSVAVLWRIVRRSFGPAAGVLAALALAVTPVNVVVNRDNILEPLLTLTLLLAAWATLAATQRGSLRWLMLGAVLVGLAFNIKAMEAYLIVPALAALYLLAAPLQWRTRLAQVALAGAVMLAISFVWITAVDLTPATQRPYVGSSATNSELDLTLGYNGILRVFGDSLFAHPKPPAAPAHHAKPHSSGLQIKLPAKATTCPQRTSCVHSKRAVPKPKLVLPNALGTPGPWRLTSWGLGQQVSWLLPLALFGLLVAWRRPRHLGAQIQAQVARLRAAAGARGWTAIASPADTPRATVTAAPLRAPRAGATPGGYSARQVGYALWIVWFGTAGVFFSVAHFINSYYTAVLAPAICALFAVGVVQLWRAYAHTQLRGGWRGWLMPLALLATGGEQAYLIASDAHWLPMFQPLWIVMPLMMALALSGMLLFNRWGESTARDRLPGRALGAVALLALLLAPALWSFSSLTWGNAGGWPIAGPAYSNPAPSSAYFLDPYLSRYLIAHRDGARYLVATTDTYIASPLILVTGQPVMAMGGFSGGDHAVTPKQLTQMIASGEVQFFLLPSSNVTYVQKALLFPTTTAGASTRKLTATTSTSDQHATHYTNRLTQLVSQTCMPVKPTLWSSATYARFRLGSVQLYQCHRATIADKDPKPERSDLSAKA